MTKLMESPSDSYEDHSTPQTPCTITLATSEKTNKQGVDGGEVENSSSSFDISQYTNGNMAEFIAEDDSNNNAAIKKDKDEFMYAFEGAMSVI